MQVTKIVKPILGFSVFLLIPDSLSKLDTKPTSKGIFDVTTANNTIASHLFVTLMMTVSNCTACSKKRSVTVTICCAHQACADFQIPARKSEYHLQQLFLFLIFHVLILKTSEQCKHKDIITKVMWLSMRQLNVYCPIWNKRMFREIHRYSQETSRFKQQLSEKGKRNCGVCECASV
jgi:hypothetical protein